VQPKRRHGRSRTASRHSSRQPMRRAGHAKPVQEEVHRTDYPDLEDNHSRIGEVVKKARNHMDAHPRAALAGARLVCRDFSSRPSAVRFPRLVSDALVLTGPAAKYSRSGFLHIWTGPRQTPCNPPGPPAWKFNAFSARRLCLPALRASSQNPEFLDILRGLGQTSQSLSTNPRYRFKPIGW
jgi:hypothetical protein